ncbi:TetR family transcriptional regulator [Burkholderia ubonensis]|uniref:TetR family transcriptional regulator n=1 Tax=Burkholderia ubonensis TaxID=101571 RepID=A0A117XAM4_9BURK|nr:TetR/AcrR family transcriptional regulator [Burkholderia ubonensis]KUZ64953.1 TetR family transcriptional regulator [Burkholderia ubonensis]KUZ82097.1 TetR family transcriptional regulator [Burkholderia ubonensis]KVA05235.1 TetR family transcriptional regulator [Burkholderia ubonensis]KVC62407.1 TetR family transcriptional regulator [Burkholderia ubonensis]KVD93626.1 TetR family transcriptional regulator [Burkholderia ubonensis]
MKKHPDTAPRDASMPTGAAKAGRAQAAERASAPAASAASGVRRKKAPEQVRSQLLAAASNLATRHGVQALTLDAVAERAGVTKGALQYHFANKQGLLDALFEQTVARFSGQVAERIAADPEPAGAASRAYMRTMLDQKNPAASTDVLRVLVASMVSEPDARERWSAPISELSRPDPVPLEQAATLMICRLAADGLWLWDLLGCQGVPDQLRAEIVRQLERMTVDAGSAPTR